METTNRIAEVTVNYRPSKKLTQLPKIIQSQDAEKHFRSIWSDRMEYLEEMYMLLLNKSNKVLGYILLSIGGTAGTVVDPKIIFQTALKTNAHGIILCHNHPSGALKPSDQDIQLTKKIREGGKLLDISLLDHLILTSEGFYSFADEGLLLY